MKFSVSQRSASLVIMGECVFIGIMLNGIIVIFNILDVLT